MLDADLVLIGAGIMSATLATWLRLVDPGLTVVILERLDRPAAESSDAWNNAGTGHSAFCELNYTPEQEGVVDVARAVKIAGSFEVSRQLWAHLVERGDLTDPRAFVTTVPHRTFVRGDDGVALLRRRHAAMVGSPFFAGMALATDRPTLDRWMPLVMDGRDPREPVAATSVEIGTDVNFGALTRGLLAALDRRGVSVSFSREVVGLRREGPGWTLDLRDPVTGAAEALRTRGVFVGAGGGALPVLQASGIPEGQRYGGFPVSGQWLVCRRPDLVARHAAKVYGRAEVGAPPMSVPHLDTRVIDGERALLFGPFAGFSTRFLKHGSLLDLPASVRARNLLPMLAAGLDNLALTRYLVEQVALTHAQRCDALRAFVPGARDADWALRAAGQRVQVIRQDDVEGGVLEFGTELVVSADGTLSALLGASPGASTAASLVLPVLERCFPDRWADPRWQARLRAAVPASGAELAADARLLAETRARTASWLGLAG